MVRVAGEAIEGRLNLADLSIRWSWRAYTKTIGFSNVAQVGSSRGAYLVKVKTIQVTQLTDGGDNNAHFEIEDLFHRSE